MSTIKDAAIHYLEIAIPVSAVVMRADIETETAKAKERLKEGETLDNAAIAEKVQRRYTLSLAMVSATRRKSYDRGNARTAARDWLKSELGLEELDGDAFDNISEDHARTWASMWQASDIIGALVPEKCKRWSPPKLPQDWEDVPDYIFTPALEKAYELNPQWQLDFLTEGN